MDVFVHPAATAEIVALPVHEQHALRHAIEKLKATAELLGFPHTSSLRGSSGLRELRPRAGRSRWRLLYRRVGDLLVVAALAPEAGVDRAGFDVAVRTAEIRLQGLKQEGD